MTKICKNCLHNKKNICKLNPPTPLPHNTFRLDFSRWGQPEIRDDDMCSHHTKSISIAVHESIAQIKRERAVRFQQAIANAGKKIKKT